MVGTQWNSVWGGAPASQQYRIRMPPAPLQGLYGGWKSLKLLGDCKDTRRSGGNKGFESPRRNKASMEGGTFRNSLEIVRTHTDQSTIRDSNVARATARRLWRVEILGIFGNGRTPTDQSTIRDSNAARAIARPLWRMEILGIPWTL